MALAPQQFCVRWNSYHTNLQTVFPKLLSSENFADVTLACENRQLRCHKVVLSACSAYFERLLVQNPCKHPIIFMKDMRFSEMQSLVDFMYKGEVNVTQDDLPSLLKSAEALHIRGLCSGDAGATSTDEADAPSAKGTQTMDDRDFTVATETLLAHAHINNCSQGNGPSTRSSERSNGPSKLGKPAARGQPELKEEQVEEDGLFYGELDHDDIEFNEDEDSVKPGSSIEPSPDFAIANVQCQYESGSEVDIQDCIGVEGGGTTDHNYDTRDPSEPPAFIIAQVERLQGAALQAPQVTSVGAGSTELLPHGFRLDLSNVNVVNVNSLRQQQYLSEQQLQMHVMRPDSMDTRDSGKRVRRSEVLLKQAADCVSRGLTFQTVSDQFNIPISTIRFFMARKGILPRRRRGRSAQTVAPPTSPTQPPFHMQHYKLPDMVALRGSDSNDGQEKPL